MVKETIVKTIIFVVLATFMVLGWGIAFGYMKSDVVHINEQADDNTENIKVVDEKVHTIDKMMTRIDTRQEVLIRVVEEINQKIK